MLYGTDEQKQRFIPRITGADDWWCTLYSEPSAGSDLASLQTRATRDGDDYIINGQKIWTSGGHLADWGWLAARTDPDAPKHKGITMFMLDMKSPGITVQPLINMADRHGFNEVFFEDVRVPASQVVGEVNRGWYHMAVALDFERSGIGAYAGGRRNVERLTKVAKETPQLVDLRPSVKNELADRSIEVAVGTILAYRVATMQAAGMVPNHEASASKLFGSEMGQRISLTGMHLLGMLGQLRNGTKHQVIDQATGYLGSVSGTIAAGTSEIQRGIIATRGLGLPRG
jgi:alkylation response protein AidB-like acyl-CoA dehydrogenase